MIRPPDFDRVARIYRWAEYASLGKTLERAREHFLPELAACRKALALGDGDGRFLARLMRQNTQMEAVAIDTSAAMLRLLRKRCGDRVRCIQASALQAIPELATDLLVTHFFFDCFEQPDVDRMVRALSSELEPGTLWVVSEFGVPRIRWLRPLAAAYVRGLYFAFRLLTGLRVTQLPDPQRPMRDAGYGLVARKEFLLGTVYTELWKRTKLDGMGQGRTRR